MRNYRYLLGSQTDLMVEGKISIRQILWAMFMIMNISCNNQNRKIPNNTNEEIIDMENEESYVRMAIEVAQESKTNGDLPFGCVLVSKSGEVLLRGKNTINTDNDCLAHAEVNLIREACKIYDYSLLNDCTIYTSDEPCPMCTSAIYWSGIEKLVYGLSKTKYYEIIGRDNPNWVFEMPVRELVAKGGRKIEVLGPLLEEEAAVLHIE